MRVLLLAVVMGACAGDGMAQERKIPPPGAALTPAVRRDQGRWSALNQGAYVPIDMVVRPSPTTLPRGEYSSASPAGWSANEALVMRVKGLDGDLPVSSLTAYHGRVAAGTETFGMALYEVIAGPGVFSGTEIQPQFLLRKMDEWFKLYAAGGATSAAFVPRFPIILERGKSYAVAVVWSVGAAGINASVSQALGASEAVKLQDAITSTTGFPDIVPVSDSAIGGISSTADVMRVEVNPARPVTSLRDFY